MMLLNGNRNRIWYYWAGKYPGKIGVLIGPSYKSWVAIDSWMPFALDNDAFKAWSDKKEWNEVLWMDFLSYIGMTQKTPIWAAVPDSVGNKAETLLKWKKFSPLIEKRGWRTAFCVQDGMVVKDVPKEACVVFVGGTDRWKFPNLKMWTEHFEHVHCARVNSKEMFEACERLGCSSIDGTGWFRDPSDPTKLPMIERFLEGHRSENQQLFQNEQVLR